MKTDIGTSYIPSVNCRFTILFVYSYPQYWLLDMSVGRLSEIPTFFTNFAIRFFVKSKRLMQYGKGNDKNCLGA